MFLAYLHFARLQSDSLAGKVKAKRRKSIMSRRLLFAALAAAIVVSVLLVVAGCKAAGGGGTAVPTTDQASRAAQTVAGSVGLVMSHSSSWTQTGASSPYTVSYSTAGLIMTGTKTVSGSDNNYVLTITLSNYSDAGTGYSVNGVVNFSIMGGATSSGTVSADVTLSGGPVTSSTWNTTFISTGGAPSFAGTITCNGTSFDAATVLAGFTDANTAAGLVLGALFSVLGNQGSWTQTGASSPYAVSYSPVTGLSMTGTLAVSGSIDTFVLAITFSSLLDSPYTVDGTLNFSLVLDTSSSTFTSGAITGVLSLSGGPVTTETLNVSNITGSTSGLFLTGTITFNGQSFDAKTF
jgi:hypothetical protein